MKNLFNSALRAIGLGPKPTFKELLKTYRPEDVSAEMRARAKGQQPPLWMHQNITRIDSYADFKQL